MKALLKLNSIAFILAFSLILILSACSGDEEWQSPHPHSAKEKWVAHAGGRINDIYYTNSLEALNASYLAGMRLIELDFEWTQDGHLVLIHDWKTAPANNFRAEPGRRTLAQFKSLKSLHGLTSLTAQELFTWLDTHPDAVIITDVKSNVLMALKWIQVHYPDYAERFIPQIYHFEEYEPVRKLGYYRVILTLYRIRKTSDHHIFNFCKTHPVWAVTMPEKRVLQGKLTKDLQQLNIPVYAHTLNDSEQIRTLLKAGVFGIYTDRTDYSELEKGVKI
jgi:glycerophosphoryl diester phosphodiesterase